MEKATVKHALRHWKNSIDQESKKGTFAFPKAFLLTAFTYGTPNKFIHYIMNKFYKLAKVDKINPYIVSEKEVKEKLGVEFPPGKDIFVNRRKYDIQIVYKQERINEIPLAIDIQDFDNNAFDFMIHLFMNIVAAVDFAEEKSDANLISKRCKAFGSEFIRTINKHLRDNDSLLEITFSDFLQEIENQFEFGIYDLTEEELGIDENELDNDKEEEKDLLDFE